MVNPDKRMCTNSVRHYCCMLPCRHGIAMYRLHKGRDLTSVKSELVHEYHKFAYVKETFKQNTYPVSMDFLTSDGTTRPPIVKKQTAGRLIHRFSCKRLVWRGGFRKGIAGIRADGNKAFACCDSPVRAACRLLNIGCIRFSDCDCFAVSFSTVACCSRRCFFMYAHRNGETIVSLGRGMGSPNMFCSLYLSCWTHSDFRHVSKSSRLRRFALV